MPELEKQYGLAKRDRGWVFRVGEDTEALAELGPGVTLDELPREVGTEVARRLGSDT